MFLSFFAILLCTSTPGIVQAKPGFDVPIQRRVQTRISKRAGLSGSTGLGNNGDVLYTIPIKLGKSVTAVNLDTGSSDLWVISNACQTGPCAGASVASYPVSNMNSTGTAVNLLYGDSSTGTFASGVAAYDTAAIAGIAMENQAFGLINSTNNPIVQFEAAGIFGLGFPSGSKVQEARVVDQFGRIEETDDFLRATDVDGPLLTRVATTGELDLPMFSITLQRSTLDIGGEGRLTIGKLPDGVLNSSLTWVPVRLYRVQDGGLRPPTFAPKEVYPFRWEVELDGVFLNGTRIPDSKIPTLGVNPGKATALIDTGNSILRGPRDMVDAIIKQISPTFDPASPDDPPVLCAAPHTLAFQIGGKMFPVDPRDLIGPRSAGDADTCIMDTLVSTDPPRVGSLYRWSLGDTFMKSNLIAFHYGNLTHPSVDPPRIGFLSTVPANAGALLKQAVVKAKGNGGMFEQTFVAAPTASAALVNDVTISNTVTPTRSVMVTQIVTSPTVSDTHTFSKDTKINSSTLFAISTSPLELSGYLAILTLWFWWVN